MILWNLIQRDSIVSSAQTFFYFRIPLRRREKKKKKKKNIENVQKFSFPLEKFLLSFLEKYDRCVHESPYVQFARRYFASESNLKSCPRFPYYRNFCPFSRTSTPRQRSYASTPPCLENPLQLAFVCSTSRLHDGSKETRLRVPKIKRNGGVLPDSSKFEQIFLTISNDLDKLESIALKPRDIYRRRFFKRAGFACFQEINQRHPGQQEARPTINYIISIDPLPSPPIYRLLSQKHF